MSLAEAGRPYPPGLFPDATQSDSPTPVTSSKSRGFHFVGFLKVQTTNPDKHGWMCATALQSTSTSGPDSGIFSLKGVRRALITGPGQGYRCALKHGERENTQSQRPLTTRRDYHSAVGKIRGPSKSVGEKQRACAVAFGVRASVCRPEGHGNAVDLRLPVGGRPPSLG
jgi:hypothetical protein